MTVAGEQSMRGAQPMRSIWKPASCSGWVLAMVIAAGCGGESDITQSADAQRSGILGQRFRTLRPFSLIDEPADVGVYKLVDPETVEGRSPARIGVIDAGTILVTSRIVRVGEVVGYMVLPMVVTREWVLATIVTGPYAGRKVNLGWEKALVAKNSAYSGDQLEPVREPAR